MLNYHSQVLYQVNENATTARVLDLASTAFRFMIQIKSMIRFESIDSLPEKNQLLDSSTPFCCVW